MQDIRLSSTALNPAEPPAPLRLVRHGLMCFSAGYEAVVTCLTDAKSTWFCKSVNRIRLQIRKYLVA